VRKKPEPLKNVCLSANTMAKGGTDLAENKRCDLQEESKNVVVHSAASGDSTNNLIFHLPNFVYVNAHNRTPLEVHFFIWTTRKLMHYKIYCKISFIVHKLR